DRRSDPDASIFRPAAPLRLDLQARGQERAARLGRASRRCRPRSARAVLMKILGLSCHYHDAAAALLVDGLPVAAVQEERLSRRKNDAAFPLAAIEYCLDEAGLEPASLVPVVFYGRPMLTVDRVLTLVPRIFPGS